MRRTRLMLSTALLLTTTLLAPGCTADPAEEDADHRRAAVEWLVEQPGVAGAVVEPTVYADDTDDWIRVETVPDLPDAEVRALVEEMGQEVLGYDTYDDSVLLSVDGFQTLLYPSSETQVLDPALWLRSDGRAASAVVGDYPDYVVTAAEPCGVFGLTGDFEETAGEQSRTTREVRAADGSSRVQWTRSDELGMELPRAAVGQLESLCEQYPGTRGWVEGVAGDFDEAQGTVLLDADDIDLDQVVADVEALVDVTDFPRGLLLGWDGLRAPATSFAEVFRGERREQALTALDAGADRVLGWGEPDVSSTGISQVQVSDLRAWEQVHDALLESAGREYLPIDLFRERPGEDRQPVDGALHSASSPLAADSAARRLVVEVAPVTTLRLASTIAGVQLRIDDEAGDDDLDRLLGATAETVPRPTRTTCSTVSRPSSSPSRGSVSRRP